MNRRTLLRVSASLLCLFSASVLLVASDLSITAASFIGSAGATYEQGTCGSGAVTAGQVVYKDSATSTYKLARANASGTSIARGIAAHAASPGQPLRIITSDPALALGATSTEGLLLAVSSATAGGIDPYGDLTTGAFPCVFGIVLDGGLTASVDFVNAKVTNSALP